MPGAWRRPSSLAAVGAVALLTGLGAGVASDLLADDGVSAQGAALAGPADECAVVQAAWSRSATLQLGMSADDPATLRRGFVGARDALVDVRPPTAVQDDWRTVTAYVGTVADEIELADEDDVSSAVAEALAGLDTAAMTAASNRVTTFLKEGCAEAGASDEPTG
ncbi:hypothetical protein SAMN04324258_3361 [Krasilnikoviella flava]|uniref:Uncharacterized protein n=1 Tax=Krasilnikoviella flava TaxID=526729 RepID=A0A1T5LHA7_9MICO|nr:hypothetical protein SAMN04324258_3361 [Krasilnikoviella flava]